MTVVDKVLLQLSSALDDGTLARRQDTSSSATMSPSSSIPATSASASASSTSSSSNGPTSSPLLFFVALGFGVVFTNLWIIVGVKYCFRYNARNRAARAAEASGEPINMENVARPHRRRREKKLMTMDEVNERFPMTKYKSWVAAREREGLPTSGGVTAPMIRPETARAGEEIVSAAPIGSDRNLAESDAKSNVRLGEIAIVTGLSGDDVKRNGVPVVDEKEGLSPDGDEHHTLETVQTTASTVRKHITPDIDDEDEDDHIHTAVPPELLTTPGDTCAICIDSLEEDDDIRGLTCGHAFHAGCIDPWLTARRASCPLCKADYYVPKPRPTAVDTPTEIDSTMQTTTAGPTLTQPPRAAQSNASRRDLLGLIDRRRDIEFARSEQPSMGSNTDTATRSRSWRPDFRAVLHSVTFRRDDRRDQDRPSPSQLEAGAGRLP